MVNVEEIFHPLIGQLIWAVEGGYGTSLTMEFGEPHLQIREPIAPKHSVSERVVRALGRRTVSIVGDWGLFIQSGDWRVKTTHGSIDSSADTTNWWKEWLDDISGQRLVSVDLAKPGGLTLHFDLDGVLEISPDPNSIGDIWSLHYWNGSIYGCRSDGTVTTETRK